MKELSLNVLDIAMNSVKAKADRIEILLEEQGDVLNLTVSDNGCGMKPEFLASVIDPFCTTRTTRRVGLGIPLLKLAAEQTGGSVTITSRHESDFPEESGTRVVATFHTAHIDCAPMGDIVSTVVTLIQGTPAVDFLFRHTVNGEILAELDMEQIRQILGEDVPPNTPEVIQWITDFLREQYSSNQKNNS